MIARRAVIVQDVAQARAALAPGFPLLLLSAEGAGLSMGVLWWRELVAAARAARPATPALDALDCADAPGLAMGALRAGQRIVLLDPTCAAFAAVAGAATTLGACALPARPPALDLSDPRSYSRLDRWLAGSVR